MIAKVIVDILNSEVDKVFDYLIPEDITVQVGDRVLLPFGNRNIEGYVLDTCETSDLSEDKLKPITKRMDEFAIIKPELIKLIFDLKEKLHLRLVDGVRLVVPSQIRNGKVNKIEIKMLRLNPDENFVLEYFKGVRANAKNEIGAIKYLQDNAEADFTKLSKMFSNSTINKLIKNNIFLVNKVHVNRQAYDISTETNKVQLNETQQKVVDEVVNNTANYLLHGVTGSGKTEVYLNIIEQMLKKGKTAIMLVPEISLTPQMIRVFTARFGNTVAVLHSGLSAGEKFDEWFRLYSGEAKIAIGARSAIFAPLDNLGVIIIDEEHDSSYVSDSNPRYNTFDVACLRAKYNNCSLLLGSATPSVETYHLTETGELKLLEMPVRINNKPMPPIEIADMCSEFRMGNKTPFSKQLMAELEKTVAEQKQAILFINRRGFSSFLMCRDCGYVPKCEACDVSLTYHKEDDQLKCHYCGKRYKTLTKCPSCGSDNLKYGGVGTEQVVEQLRGIFPDVKIFRMDNDTTQNKNAYARILGDFGASKPAILVGTQMIAKGHDFPEVNLVGILDADLSLYFGDFRASEKTFQLITQVAGRAGRSKIDGKVVLQTYFPKHYVYKLCASYNYPKFYEKEINLRETTLFPPFSTIVRLLLTSESDDKARNYTHDLFVILKELRVKYKSDFYFLEAMKSPVTKIKNKYRYQILMRFSCDKSDEIKDEIYSILDGNKNKNVSCFVEINPLSLS